jgi:hypothetical protein
LALFHFFFICLVVFFDILLLSLSTEATLRFTFFIIIIVASLTYDDIALRISLVKDVFLVIESLSK